MAVSHSVLVILYHMLKDHCPSSDLGADYFDQLDRARVERHHVRRLEQLGYTVTLTPAPAAWAGQLIHFRGKRPYSPQHQELRLPSCLSQR
jgi:hypothetical protein